MSKIKYVTTISGKQVLLKNCELIDNKYYEKNSECVFVKEANRYYPINSDDIGFDEETNSYRLSKSLENEQKRKFITGFTKNNEPIIKYKGYSEKLKFFRVHCASHLGEISKELNNLEKDRQKISQQVDTYMYRLNPESLFYDNYKELMKFLSTIFYINRLYTNPNFKKVDITSKEDLMRACSEYYMILNHDPQERNFFNSFMQIYFSEFDYQDGKEETREKHIDFIKINSDKTLVFLYDVFLEFIGIVKTLENGLKKFKNDLASIEGRIKKIYDSGYFEEYCESKEKALELGFIESFKSDKMYLKRNLSPQDLQKLQSKSITFGEGVYNNLKLNYGASEDSSAFKRIWDYYNWLRPFQKGINKNAYNVAKLLKGLSIGIEFETASGRIREQDLHRLGLIPLRDGSISGFEYTTIPFGLKENLKDSLNPLDFSLDLVNIKEICKELSHKCNIDTNGSMHLHIGGTRNDKLFIIALYMLCYLIQNEMFEFQPEYKKDSIKIAGTKRNYCQKLNHLDLFDNCIFDKSSVLKENYCDNVNSYFNRIFKFLSSGQELGSVYNRKSLNHPYNKKWDREARYYWVNFVNSVFSKSHTIEFRLHTATTNPNKVINWILICAAIVKYAENHTKDIISGKINNINLNTILAGYTNHFCEHKQENMYGVFVYNYLKEYVASRKEFFKKLNEKKDFLGKEEFNNDASYVFDYHGVTELY